MKRIKGRRGSPPPKVTAPKVINQPCTHLPDCVVFADHRKELPSQSSFQGVLMFLDISGRRGLFNYSSNLAAGISGCWSG